MLLLDDGDQLPEVATDAEKALALSLGKNGCSAIDDAILASSRSHWLKVARVVFDAIDVLGQRADDSMIQLCVRRVIGLVNKGLLAAQGNLYRPRFSEVRLPDRS